MLQCMPCCCTNQKDLEVTMKLRLGDVDVVYAENLDSNANHLKAGVLKKGAPMQMS